MTSILSRPYETIDAAALGGFRKILMSYQDWQNYEYGFFVVGFDHDIARPIGHEVIQDKEMQYFYTGLHTSGGNGEVEQDIPPGLTFHARALCHTHPTTSNFSSGDFDNFKRLRELKAKHKLGFDIIYYLMDKSRQVRRSDTTEGFMNGAFIPGLDKAIP